ncbi:MAG: hydrogenase large subunit [Candidatus Methylomirabilia bacterium]
MSRLLRVLKSALGLVVRADPSQFPTSLAACTVPSDRFADAGGEMKKAHALLVAEWATDETAFGRGYGVYACYRWAKDCVIVRAGLPVADPSFPTLTASYAPAFRFERQMRSLMGVHPSGHPDLRPWIAHEDWPAGAYPLRKGFDPSQPLTRGPGVYPWIRAAGEGVYEIAVGPVHAGIIEPGHFRFHAVGEDVVNLEERLGYVHKGIEKRFESLPWAQGHRLAGRVSGDTTVAHALGYCMALESMSGGAVPERAHWIRALLLERERIANHCGDLGAIANDAAFAFLWHQMARLREQVLRTNRTLFGHRFMMDRVVPGGVAGDLTSQGRAEIERELTVFLEEFERLVTIYDENASLDDRVRGTGVLSPAKALDLCVVGVVARASGINHDCRVFNPFPPYDRPEEIELDVPVLISGDVHARAWVRVLEVRESVRLIRYILEHLPEGPVLTPLPPPAAGVAGFAAVEGWRGEIVYWLQSGPGGEVNRCMVRDPSSLNWIGLEQAITGNIVPDFPLCNKSFNQSYSGHDL